MGATEERVGLYVGLIGMGGRLGVGGWVSRAFGWLSQGCEGQGEEHKTSPATPSTPRPLCLLARNGPQREHMCCYF